MSDLILYTVGMVLGYIVLTACYYANVFHGRDLKFMSSSLFDSTGETYNQTIVIDSNYHLNETALADYGLPRYTTTYAISQLSYNISLGSAVTYILLWNWTELRRGKSHSTMSICTVTDRAF